ncbi:MAG: class II SORL domain-containing protein [Thermoprotei archaeon]
MAKLHELIYSPERASGEAVSKIEAHTPKIEAPDKVKADEPFEIRVWVGPHPNTVEHSIRWIEVYFEEDGRSFNPYLLARFMPEPGITEPDLRIRVRLKKSGTIHAIEYCNLHGLWENSKRIEVE